MRVVFDAIHRQEPDGPTDCVCRLPPLRNICRRDLGWPCLLDGTPWLPLLNDGKELSLHLEGVLGELVVGLDDPLPLVGQLVEDELLHVVLEFGEDQQVRVGIRRGRAIRRLCRAAREGVGAP